MIFWIFRQILTALITLLGVSLVSFALIRVIPGDPVMHMIGERGASPEVIAEMRAKMGLDQSLVSQYANYIMSAAQGNFGNSIISGRPVWEEFMDRFPATVELGFVALLMATLIGIPFGLLAAMKRGRVLDYVLMTVSLVGYSMPIFWWGLILILFFSIQLNWLPVSGRVDVAFEIPVWSGFYLLDSFRASVAGSAASAGSSVAGFLSGFSFQAENFRAAISSFTHILLPAIALGTIPLAVIARMTRSAMLEVLGEDYVRTAKAKGLPVWRIVWVHAFRNALIPVITVVGLMAGTLVTGAVLTETIFSWPGIGKWIVQSVLSRDYPVIQGGLLLIAFLVVFVNMLSEMACTYVNPKLRELMYGR